MIIEIYGRKECELCQSAKRKIAHLLERWALGPQVQVAFVDTDTEYGAAESDFFDVFEIPTVLLKKNRDEVVARWEGKPPSSKELRGHLRA